MKTLKKIILFVLVIIIIFAIIHIRTSENRIENNFGNVTDSGGLDLNITEKNKNAIIVPGGTTLEKRISVPYGFSRVYGETGSFCEFLRSYPLKDDGSPVLLYNGQNKGNQNAHTAVLKLPIENADLQQCADSVMRIYAEYFFENEEYNKISFHLTNGFLAEYSKWRDGYRIKINGNKTSWVKSKQPDSSYESFKAFMRVVFSYAGTLSMEKEAHKIGIHEIEPGDVFLYGASPGHVVMILDVCENEDGKKAFLLGQGYMPAQEFHVLKNPKHSDDPWYYEDEFAYPFETPEYTFSDGSLKRLCYLN